ncbi:hypothetical protein SUGI_0116360 [Cryptomeria japonica]|nr:hypothetical protein SUGI_0116360 [Cryptomeria japonica]
MAHLCVAQPIFFCGEHVFDYDFGFKNSGRGDLSLQVECDYGHRLPKPLLDISVAVSVPEACKAQAVLPVNNSGGPVDDHQIMHGGFPIKWNVSKSCRDCQSSGGRCGYYNSPMQFHCRCRRHSLYPGRCPADHSGWFNTPNKTAIAIMTGIIGSASLIIAVLLVIAYRKKMFFNHEVPGRKRGNLRSISKLKCLITHGKARLRVTSALVYKYMANVSLDKFILAGKEKDQVLNWNQLYSIAFGAARGIAYLHNGCHNRIIHFDIKPHNILLDKEFIAKVGDFGLAKLCGRRDEHVPMTAARGTPGYVAPEVWSRNLGPVTDKSDVYSFGMMLLEMVGGRKNIDVQLSRSSQFYFPEWAFKLIENGELRTRLREREISGADEAKARSLAKVGLWCIQYNSTDRPSMMRVLQMLEGGADDIPNPPTPFSARPPAAPFSASEESSTIEIETAS